MFSSRLNWDLRPNRISLLLEARRRAAARILDLTESNPTHAGLSYPAGGILAALGDARSLVYEPSAAGALEARSAVAAYYALRGASVPPDRLVLTASTSEAYGYVFKLLADPGDEVLVPRPSYPLFEFLARLESVREVDYRVEYDGSWRIDFASLEAAVTPRTRAVVVVNPNNPTGSFLKAGELDRLVALAAERDMAIVSDEVFSDYTLAPDAERVATLTGVTGALTFCLSGLSKTIGLPQMKLGWIATGGPDEARVAALARLELIADTYLSASAPVQYGAARLLEAGAVVRAQIQARVAENLAWLLASVAGSAVSVLKVEGGWYATLEVPRTRSEEEWTLELLAHDGVLVQPGFFFDFESEAFLVVSLLTTPEVFREGVGLLLARVAE